MYVSWSAAENRTNRAAPFAITDFPALRQDGRAAAAVDRPVDSASPQERRIRGIDDRVDVLVRDVSLEKRESNTVDANGTVGDADRTIS